VIDVVKQVAEATAAGGYPEPKLRAEVAAEASEFKDTEECLRLRLVLYYTMEGDAKRPAAPGWISTAAFCRRPRVGLDRHGHPWASALDAGDLDLLDRHEVGAAPRDPEDLSKTVRGTEGALPDK
jgi:hypothetical protein